MYDLLLCEMCCATSSNSYAVRGVNRKLGSSPRQKIAAVYYLVALYSTWPSL